MTDVRLSIREHAVTSAHIRADGVAHVTLDSDECFAEDDVTIHATYQGVTRPIFRGTVIVWPTLTWTTA